MQKLKPTFPSYWQTRYFVLKFRMLRYYKSEADMKAGKAPRGILNFQQVCFMMACDDKACKIGLQPKGCDRVFNLKCSKDSYEAWKRNIQTSIESSVGYIRDLDMSWFESKLEKSFKFWSYLRIPEKSFFEQAETGDILLCANKKSFDIKKMKTANPVDRVFLIYRMDVRTSQIGNLHDKELGRHYVLRVDAKNKCVILDEWTSFTEYCRGKFTDIIFRHLYVDRDDHFLKKASNYAEDMMNDPTSGAEISLVSEVKY